MKPVALDGRGERAPAGPDRAQPPGEQAARAPTDFCVCPKCLAELLGQHDRLRCTDCGAAYRLQEGIPVLLVEPKDPQTLDYREFCDGLARRDLREPLVPDKGAYQDVLVKFIGKVRGRRVLDVGSSQGLYLRRLDAGLKVALDLALPYLREIPPESGIVRICADAERLPVKPGFFDVIILSDVLEHVLHPEAVVESLIRIAGPGTRIIVMVPWEEDLSKYVGAGFKYAHLRSFNSDRMFTLFQAFRLRKRRFCYPAVECPWFMALEPRLPRAVFNRLLNRYMSSSRLQIREQERLGRWVRELPRRERRLLWLYRPVFRILEFRRPVRLRLLKWMAARLLRRGRDEQPAGTIGH